MHLGSPDDTFFSGVGVCGQRDYIDHFPVVPLVIPGTDFSFCHLVTSFYFLASVLTTDWFTPAVNGVVTSVLNLRRGLENRGHEVRILPLSRSPFSYV